MIFRYSLLFSLSILLFTCSKITPPATKTTSDVHHPFTLSETDRKLLKKSIFHIDSISLQEPYIITQNAPCYTVPNKSVITFNGRIIQNQRAKEGDIVWKTPVTSLHHNELTAVFYCYHNEYVKLVWISEDVLQPYTDTSSLATLRTIYTQNIHMALRLLHTAIAIDDTVLASWAIHNGVLPTHGKRFIRNSHILHAAESENNAMYTLLRNYMDTSIYALNDRIQFSLLCGDRKDLTESIRRKIRTRVSGETFSGVKSGLCQAFLLYAMAAKKPQIMLRGFKAAFKIAPQYALDTLSAATIKSGIQAAIRINDTASIALLLKYYPENRFAALLSDGLIFKRNNRDAVLYMLSLAENRNIPGITTIYIRILSQAAQYTDTILCHALLSRGISIPDTPNSNNDILSKACQIRFTEGSVYHTSEAEVLAVVRMLLAHGVNVNGPLPVNATSPLFLAIKNGYFNVARELISRGAEVNIAALVPDEYGEPFEKTRKTPLYFAAAANDTALVNVLLTANASPVFPGCDLLRAACIANSVQLFKRFSALGCQLRAVHLSFASFYGSDSIVTYLTGSKMPDLASPSDSTTSVSPSIAPLAAAVLGARYRHPLDFYDDNGRYQRTLSTLLAAGYRIDLTIEQNGDTLTPIECAAESRRFDLVNVLHTKGATITPKVISYSLSLGDPETVIDFIHKYQDSFSGTFPHTAFYSLYQKAQFSQHFNGSALVDTLRTCYLRYRSEIFTGLRKKAAENIARSESGEPIVLKQFLPFLSEQLRLFNEKYAGFVSMDFWRESSLYRGRYRLPKAFNQHPLTLNTENFKESNWQPDIWFRHYNPRIIDACTRSLDNKILRNKVTSTFRNKTLSSYIFSNISINDILSELLVAHEEIYNDTLKALAHYQEYYDNPFRKIPAYDYFKEYSNSSLGAFWTRRLIDGSASSFHRLFKRLSHIFPPSTVPEEYYRDEYEEEEYSENP